jgi:hypothetical protein
MTNILGLINMRKVVITAGRAKTGADHPAEGLVLQNKNKRPLVVLNNRPLLLGSNSLLELALS